MPLSSRARKWLKRVAWTICGLVAGTVLLFAAVFAALHTQWGLDTVADLVQDTASSEDMRIELQGLASAMPWDLRLGRLGLADAEGIWLEADDIAVGVDLWPLLQGAISIDHVLASRVAWLRPPISKEEPEPSEPISLAIPKIPPLRLDELRVDRLLYHLPPEEGQGEPQVKAFRVEGAIRPVQRDFILDLSAVELPDAKERGASTAAPAGFRPDTVVLQATLAQDAGELAIDASLQEGSGGLVASALGLEEGTAVSGGLKGSGPLDDWGGDLHLDIGGSSLFAAQLTLGFASEDGADRLSLGLDGGLDDVAGLLPPDVAQMTGSTATLSLDLALDDPTGKPSLTLHSLTIRTPTLEARLSADLANERLTASLGLSALEQSLLESLTSGALQGAPVVSVELEADQDKAVAEISAELGALTMEQLSSGPAKLTATLNAEHPLDESRRVLDLEGGLDVKGLRPPDGVALEESLTVAFALRMEERSRLQVRSLTLDNGENELSAKGDVDLEAMSVDAILAATLPNAGALFMLHPLNAAVTLQAEAKGDMERGINVSLSGNVAELAGLEPRLAELLGPRLELKLQAAVDEKLARLESLDISGHTSLSAQGRYGLGDGSLDASLKVTPPRQYALPPEQEDSESPLSLEGISPLTISATGNLERLEVAATFAAGALHMPGRAFNDVQLSLAAGLPLAPSGDDAQAAADDFSLELKSKEASASLSSRYSLLPGRLELSSIDLTLPGVHLGGRVAVDLDTSLAQGSLKLAAKDLSALNRFAGMELAGGLSADIELSSEGATQGLRLEATGKGLAVDGATVQSLKVDFESANVLGLATGEGRARLTLATGRAGTADAYADSLKLEASLTQKAVELSLKTLGQAFRSFDLDLRATLRPFEPTFAMELASLQGAYGEIPLRLQKPMALSLPGGGVRIEGLELGLGNGMLTMDGTWGPQQADFTVKLEDISLDSVRSIDTEGMADMPRGNVDLDIHLKGDMKAPRMDLKLAATELELPAAQEGGDIDLPALGLLVTASYESRRLSAEAVLRNDEEGTAKPLLQATAGVPMILTLEPLFIKLEDSAPLQGTAKSEMELAMLQGLLGMTSQVLGGVAMVDATLEGSLGEPDVNGTLRISKGQYENLKIGTVLKDLDLELTAQGQEVVISKLSATDGGNGSISGKGKLTFEGDNPFEATVSLASLTPVHMDIFTGALSGDLNIIGDLKSGAKVKGDLTVDHAELMLPKGLPPDVAVVPVKEINTGEDEKQAKKEDISEYPVALKIKVRIPGQFYVTGHGLDSEWEGTLDVKGRAVEPRIMGNLTVRRGSFDFLDKKFTIEEGVLSFSGATPPAPLIKVVTATQAKDILARVMVEGTPDNLKFSFSSEPYLPENEILAAVLFGRRMDSLTPMQALRLARAVDELSGGGGGDSLSVLGDIQDALGVDELSAGEGKVTGGTTLQAGKYITDDVYVKGSKGLDPRDDSVSVEVQITPNLGLESEMGSDSESGVGLNWRYDY